MKQPYTTPTLFKIKLDYQQAILAACSESASGRMKHGTGRGCESRCRRSAIKNVDSGAGS